MSSPSKSPEKPASAKKSSSSDKTPMPISNPQDKSGITGKSPEKSGTPGKSPDKPSSPGSPGSTGSGKQKMDLKMTSGPGNAFGSGPAAGGKDAKPGGMDGKPGADAPKKGTDDLSGLFGKGKDDKDKDKSKDDKDKKDKDADNKVKI